MGFRRARGELLRVFGGQRMLGISAEELRDADEALSDEGSVVLEILEIVLVLVGEEVEILGSEGVVVVVAVLRVENSCLALRVAVGVIVARVEVVGGALFRSEIGGGERLGRGGLILLQEELALVDIDVTQVLGGFDNGDSGLIEVGEVVSLLLTGHVLALLFSEHFGFKIFNHIYCLLNFPDISALLKL